MIDPEDNERLRFQFSLRVRITPAGDAIATAGDDGEVKFWNIAEHKQLEAKLKYKHDGIDQLQFSSGGKYLVTAGDGWLKVWDSPDFTIDHHVQLPEPGPVVHIDLNAIAINGDTIKYEDGVIVTKWPDGRLREVFPNGTVKNTDAYGKVTEAAPDGTIKNYKQY